MDVREIEKTIIELENGTETFDTCIKLAALYSVREHLSEDAIVSEYRDILPSYTQYKAVKTDYQQHKASAEQVMHQLDLLCGEVSEFLHILYISADFSEEKQKLHNLFMEMASQ